MADWLLLRLPRAPDPDAEWLVCDTKGSAGGVAQRGALSDAAALAAGCRVCVLVPSSDVLYTQVDLPPRAGARALQMTRYALEEQLLGDLEAQHFTIARQGGNTTRTAVAVVARTQMDEWLRTLQSAGIQPDALVADGALLPANPMQTLAWIDGDSLTLKPQRPLAEAATTSNAAAADALLCLPANSPEAALRMAFGDFAGAGVDLEVYVTEGDWQRYGAQFEALRPHLGNLHVQLLGGGALPWLAPQLASATALNLLQGDYEQRRSSGNLWPRWRLAAALAIALLLLHVGDRVYSLWGLRRAETGVDAALVKLGEQTLPGMQIDTVTLRRQVQAQLTAGAGRDAGALLAAMQSLAKSLGGAGRLRALSFRDGNTEMQLRARDVQTVERVKQALRSDGLNAELVGGGASAGVYEGHIQIKQVKSAAPAGGRS
jgi:general secretion pathway protein L